MCSLLYYEKFGHAVRSNGVSGSASNTTMNLLVNCDIFSSPRLVDPCTQSCSTSQRPASRPQKKTEVTAIAELPHIFPRHGHQVIRHFVGYQKDMLVFLFRQLYTYAYLRACADAMLSPTEDTRMRLAFGERNVAQAGCCCSINSERMASEK